MWDTHTVGVCTCWSEGGRRRGWGADPTHTANGMLEFTRESRAGLGRRVLRPSVTPPLPPPTGANVEGGQSTWDLHFGLYSVYGEPPGLTGTNGDLHAPPPPRIPASPKASPHSYHRRWCISYIPNKPPAVIGVRGGMGDAGARGRGGMGAWVGYCTITGPAGRSLLVLIIVKSPES